LKDWNYTESDSAINWILHRNTMKIKPVTDVEVYNGINIFIVPILNGDKQTGTRYQFTVGSMKRQAFTLEAAHSLIDDILAVQLPPEPNPLVDVTDRAKVQKAMRGGQGDLKSEIPFG